MTNFGTHFCFVRFPYIQLYILAHMQSLGAKFTCKFQGTKTHFRSSLNSTAVLNLNCSLVFFFKSFFLYFLKKVPKNMGSRVRHSVLKVDNIAFSHPVRCKLRLHCARLYAVNVVDLQSKFKSRFATSFSRCTPRRSLLVAMLGAARTRYAQTSCRLFQSLLGYSLCLPTLPFRPWRGITFCNEQARRIVISTKLKRLLI